MRHIISAGTRKATRRTFPLIAAILFAAGVVQIRVVLGTWPYDRRVVKGIVAAGVAATALAALRLGSDALSLPAGVFLVLTVIVAALAFGGTLFGLGLDDEDRFILEAILASARSQRRTPST